MGAALVGGAARKMAYEMRAERVDVAECSECSWTCAAGGSGDGTRITSVQWAGLAPLGVEDEYWDLGLATQVRLVRVAEWGTMKLACAVGVVEA